MSELPLDASLVGQTVRNLARPEWGEGKVTRVERLRVDGEDKTRVYVQFHVVGQRVMLVPPARLGLPTKTPERQAGWLDQMGKSTLDDRLRGLPTSVTEVLGGPRAKLAAVLPLYAYDDSPAALVRWATRQTDVPDPLSQWNRDELEVAFAAFCIERDSYLRTQAALLKQKEGDAALRELLRQIPAELRTGVDAALRRVV